MIEKMKSFLDEKHKEQEHQESFALWNEILYQSKSKDEFYRSIQRLQRSHDLFSSHSVVEQWILMSLENISTELQRILLESSKQTEETDTKYYQDISCHPLEKLFDFILFHLQSNPIKTRKTIKEGRTKRMKSAISTRDDETVMTNKMKNFEIHLMITIEHLWKWTLSENVQQQKKDSSSNLSFIVFLQNQILHFLRQAKHFGGKLPFLGFNLLSDTLRDHAQQQGGDVKNLSSDFLFLTTNVIFELLYPYHPQHMDPNKDEQYKKDNDFRSMMISLRSTFQSSAYLQTRSYCSLLAKNVSSLFHMAPMSRGVYLQLLKEDDFQSLSADSNILDTIAYLMLYHVNTKTCIHSELGDEQRNFFLPLFPTQAITHLLTLIIKNSRHDTEDSHWSLRSMESNVIDSCMDLFVLYISNLSNDFSAHTSSEIIPSLKSFITQIHDILPCSWRNKIANMLFCVNDFGVDAISDCQFHSNQNRYRHDSPLYSIKDMGEFVLFIQGILIDLIKMGDCNLNLEIKSRLGHIANTIWYGLADMGMMTLEQMEYLESVIHMYSIALVVQYEEKCEELLFTDLVDTILNNIQSFMESETKQDSFNCVELALLLARYSVQSHLISPMESQLIVETVMNLLSSQSIEYCDPVVCFHATRFLSSLCSEASSLESRFSEEKSIQEYLPCQRTVYSVDEIFPCIKDFVMQLKLVRKVEDSLQPIICTSIVNCVTSFTKVPSYVYEKKKYHRIIISPVSFINYIKWSEKTPILWTRLIHCLFDTYLWMGRILSTSRWSRDSWITARVDLVSRNRYSYELDSVCTFLPPKEDSPDDDSIASDKFDVEAMDDLAIFAPLIVFLAGSSMLSAILRTSFSESEVSNATPKDMESLILIVEKIYYIQSLIQAELKTLSNISEERWGNQISLVKSLISKTSMIIPLCHLRACIIKSNIAKQEYASLFRGFISGIFQETQHISLLKGFTQLISIHSSVLVNLHVVLSALHFEATRDQFEKNQIHDLLIGAISTIFLWLNSLNAFFLSEPYLSGRVEVSEPRVLFAARNQMQLYINRALKLLALCVQGKTFHMITSKEAQDLISMSMRGEDVVVQIQLLDILYLVCEEDEKRDDILVRTLWKLLCTENITKNSSEPLRPSPMYQIACDHLRTKCSANQQGSNQIINTLLVLEERVQEDFREYNLLTHCLFGYWGILMNRPFSHKTGFYGVVNILNNSIPKFQRGTLERRNKDALFEDETIFVTKESLFLLYDITFNLIIATIFHCMTESDSVEDRNEATIAYFDCFGLLTKSLEIHHEIFPKSLMYSTFRACVVMIDICHEQIQNVIESGHIPGKSRTSSGLKSVLSAMKVECCDRVASLSNRLMRVVPIGEKVILKTLKNKSDNLGVHIYQSGISSRMVPSSLEIFGATNVIANSKTNPVMKKNHGNRKGMLHITSKISHGEDDDEFFKVTGDWGGDDLESNSDASENGKVQLEHVA